MEINFSSLTDFEITQKLYKRYKVPFYFCIIILFIFIAIYYGRKYYIHQKYRRLFSGNNLILYESKPKEVLTSNIIIESKKFSLPMSNHCFTYSVFLFVKDWYINYGKYKHIFHRGTDVIEDYTHKCRSSLSWNQIPEQYPGMWFDKTTNDIWITLSTKIKTEFPQNKDKNCQKKNQEPYYVNTIEYAKLENIPISSYFCLTAVFDKNKIELYLNGQLRQTKMLLGIPIESNENGFIGIGNSFAGNIANFRYIPYSLYPDEVYFLYNNKRHQYNI